MIFLNLECILCDILCIWAFVSEIIEIKMECVDDFYKRSGVNEIYKRIKSIIHAYIHIYQLAKKKSY